MRRQRSAVIVSRVPTKLWPASSSPAYRKPKSQCSGQAIYCGLVYVEGPRNFPNRLAFRKQLRCNLKLIWIEFAWPAEVHTAQSRCRTARSGPLADQIPLELGDTGENGHDHLPRV